MTRVIDEVGQLIEPEKDSQTTLLDITLVDNIEVIEKCQTTASVKGNTTNITGKDSQTTLLDITSEDNM